MEKVTKTSGVKDFTQKTATDDLTLLIENQSLYVSKAVLSIASPVFKTMFESGFKESRSKELELPEKSYKAFCLFLNAIYPCGLDVVTKDTVFDIFPLAEEFQVTTLKVKCVNCFQEIIADGKHFANHQKSLENLYTILQLTRLYNMGDTTIINKCLKSIVSNWNCFEEIQKVEAKFTLHSDVKVQLRDMYIKRMLKDLQRFTSTYT